jgi:hypothetical protein
LDIPQQSLLKQFMRCTYLRAITVLKDDAEQALVPGCRFDHGICLGYLVRHWFFYKHVSPCIKAVNSHPGMQEWGCDDDSNVWPCFSKHLVVILVEGTM